MRLLPTWDQADDALARAWDSRAVSPTIPTKFRQKVLTDLRNRGVRDVLIVCCDGLTGLPEVVVAVFPDTVVQTCVVHVITDSHDEAFNEVGLGVGTPVLRFGGTALFGP